MTQAVTSGTRARILMLSIVNPMVEHNGASTVTRGLLRALALPPLQAEVELLPVRPQPVRWHRLAQARSLLRSVISELPAKAAFLYSKEFQNRVAAEVRHRQYDVAILNGADLLCIADSLPRSLPRILVAHNIEHQLFRLQIEHLGWSRWPLRGLLQRDCRRLEEYELDGMREAGNVIFLSADEAAYAQSRCAGLRSLTMPPVFDYEPAIRQPRKPGPVLELGLLGNFGWWPNQLSLGWFVEKVLPGVKVPVRLNLFGRPSGRGWKGDPRVLERGVVKRIEEVWESCDFLICPAFATGGVSVKLAEAVYNRMPVLATTPAARGLPVGDDPALVFLDEPDQWIEFLNSPAARQLAERRTAAATSARFAVGTHKEKIQPFVEAATAGTRAMEVV